MRRSLPPGGRDAALLLLARTFMSAQRALVGVVVPIYLARRGFSGTEVGIFFTVVALASAALSAAIGFLADRVGRRPFLIWIPLLSAGAAVVFAFVNAPAALLAAAAAGSFGRGSGAGAGMIGPYQPAEQALIAGLVDDRRRARLFGFVASASALGGLLGAALAASPLASGHRAATVSALTYRDAFIAAAALAASTALCALPVRERDPRSHRERRTGQSSRRLSRSARGLVTRLIATNTVNGAAVGLFGPFISYWLYRRYGAGPAEIGTLYIIGNVITIATNQLAAPFAARHGTVRVVVAARTAQALLLLPLGFAPSFVAAGAIYTTRLVVQRIGMALRQSFVMTAAPAHERSRVAALSQLPVQGVSALTPSLAGYMFDELSLSAPFELGGVLQLMNAALFHRFFGASEQRAGAEQPAAAGSPLSGRVQRAADAQPPPPAPR